MTIESPESLVWHARPAGLNGAKLFVFVFVKQESVEVSFERRVLFWIAVPSTPSLACFLSECLRCLSVALGLTLLRNLGLNPTKSWQCFWSRYLSLSSIYWYSDFSLAYCSK